MKHTKIAAVLIVAALMLTLFVGCGEKTVSPLVSDNPDTTEGATETAGSTSPADTMNTAGAYASLEPDTVVLTIEGNDITWDKLFYLINYSVGNIEQQGGQITDWSAKYADDITYEDYVLDSAVNYTLQDEAIVYGAEQLGVTLTDEEQSEVQNDWDAQVEAAGSEDAFIATLEDQFCNKDIYMDLVGGSQLAKVCFDELYGEEGAKLTDEEINEYTAGDGYMMAKHILMLTTKTDADGNQTDMTNAEKAQVHEKMEEIISQLDNYQGDAFDAFFDELMNANSEDPGVSGYPQGYLFQSGDMVGEFEAATTALDIGQVSDIVETDYGYHIIYRIPINYEIMPMSYANYGTYSLRYITALMMFNAVQDVWLNSLDITYSDDFNTIELSKIFAVG